MSYTVRDDNAIFGPLAAVEYPNGAGASVIGCIQNFEPIELIASAATLQAFNTVFIAPPAPSTATNLPALGQKYQIVGVSYYYSTASTSGTMSIEVVPAGTANGSGTNVLSTANVSLSTAATTTPNNATLNANIDNLFILPNSRVNVNSAGTLTNLVDLAVMIYITRIA
jgi:hypothetical protein